MNFKLKVWRQKDRATPKASSSTTRSRDISPDTSFLEMLDIVNEQLLDRGEEPIAFDSDCREGICGTCSLNDQRRSARTAIIRRRPASFTCGNSRMARRITIEPFRARSFPMIKDLVVDRSALDRIVQAGGFVSARTGSAPEANSIPVPKHNADLAMEAAACIGCGACAAACPNASAMLFTSAKVSHLALLPQGQPERTRRVLRMVRQMDAGRFRQLHEHLRMRSGLPGRDQRQFHRETESRIRHREPGRTPWRVALLIAPSSGAVVA